MKSSVPAKILYVDDDDDLIHIYTRFLEGEQYILKTASNGEEGFAEALSFQPDLIISDVAMPTMDGLELCRRVRGEKSLKYVAFMLFSGIDVEGKDVVAGLEAGADEYLVKPFSKDELLARITLLLNIKGLKERADLSDRCVEDELKHREKLERQLDELKEELVSERQTHSASLKQVAFLVEERQRAVDRADGEALKASRTLSSCVELLSRALDTRPGFKRGHSGDVARLSVTLGEALGLERSALKELETAAKLHHLGLLHITETLAVRNPFEWSQTETDLLSRHPFRAAEMLEKVEGLQGVARIIRHLFERVDGEGIPAGLKKEAIPMASRILAVADAYETLAAWSEGGGVADRLGRLEEDAGTQFDPKVVHALARHLGRKPESDAADRVEVGIYEVKPGMVLASAIYTAKGAMLLPENTVLTEAYIRQISRYNRIDPLEETVFIKG
ncbi:MAG: response regulator [Desulfobacterales bacterium]|nr:response regulator [Desulfobacterales bacterium]